MTLATRLLDLADRLRRLPPPGHRDPERFHLERDDLAAELRRLAADSDHDGGERRPDLRQRTGQVI